MSGLNSIMDSSLSALFAAQAGLATTGHNIANANTPGYSRQSVLFAARRPEITPYGAIGRGVTVQGIRRIQDDFLTNNLRAQTARRERYGAVDSTLNEIETILGSIENDRIGGGLTAFFGAWNSMAQPPITDSMKDHVVTNAVRLVNEFHAVNDSLNDLEKNIDNNIQLEIGNLNELLTQVGELNRQIMSAESGGHPANDLRDQRDFLITEVSKIAEVSVLQREDGTKDIILAGRTMVSRDSVTLFSAEYVETSNGYRMSIVTTSDKKDIQLSPGKLQGLLDSRDINVKTVREQLDRVAKMLIDQVNELHMQGRTASSSGLQFFTGDDMRTIGVTQALIGNASLVATGRTSAPGDNTLALEIANLTNLASGGPGARTITEEYRATLTDLASNRNTYQFMVINQDNVVATLEAKMASVSGVSLDEEGAAMVRYQNSYNAAAKVIATVQELYDVLLSMV